MQLKLFPTLITLLLALSQPVAMYADSCMPKSIRTSGQNKIYKKNKELIKESCLDTEKRKQCLNKKLNNYCAVFFDSDASKVSKDRDLDGLKKAKDNCPYIENRDQLDTDNDGRGDVCFCDSQGDGGIIYSDVQFLEFGEPTTSIDTVQDDDCDGDSGTFDPEPFSDNHVNFTLTNSFGIAASFATFGYRIKNLDGDTEYQTDAYELNTPLTLAGNCAATNETLILLSELDGIKYILGATLPESLIGFKEIELELRGNLANGQAIYIQKSVNVSFGDFNNC